jgi:hypothetical protein
MIDRIKARPFSAIAFACVLLYASVTFGAIVFDALSELPPSSPPAYVIAAVTTSDQSTYDTPLRPRRIKSNAKAVFSPTFSVAGATAVFEVALYHEKVDGTRTFWTLAGPITVTAKSRPTDTVGGRYVATSENVLPTLGAQVYDLRLVSISSGDVRWTQAAVGCDTIVATTANE